jgi:peptidoglycan/LPS O-acetylase OafA/YrhL
MPAPPRPTIVSVQCLRGVAALLVVLFHMQGAAAIKLPGRSALDGFFALRQLGSIGVDIFFVISGFIMVHVSHARFQQRGAALDFLVRRAIRIVPLAAALLRSAGLRHAAIPTRPHNGIVSVPPDDELRRGDGSGPRRLHRTVERPMTRALNRAWQRYAAFG